MFKAFATKGQNVLAGEEEEEASFWKCYKTFLVKI